MIRREFLRILGLVPFSGLWLDPTAALAAPLDGPADWSRTLVLVELHGGNDGLNTVVPFEDPAYRRLRPRLALAKDELVGAGRGLWFHAALAPLVPLMKDGELAVVEGVGYPAPNRSHFRSIEIWEAGSASDRTLFDGWVTRLFGLAPPPSSCEARGLVLGRGDAGPLGGETMRDVLVMNDPERLPGMRDPGPATPSSAANPALAHLLAVRRDLARALARLEAKLAAARPPAASFPAGPLGAGLQAAARLLTAGVAVPVIKVGLGSFDHHANQKGAHARLLGQLGEALAAFRTALRAAGRWDDVLVMTYSEFGRRAGENGSLGTDHGTAAPHFVLGGRVAGGRYGAAPSLTDLDREGDLKHTTDYRDLYATIARRWWGIAGEFLPGYRPSPLGFLA